MINFVINNNKIFHKFKMGYGAFYCNLSKGLQSTCYAAFMSTNAALIVPSWSPLDPLTRGSARGPCWGLCPRPPLQARTPARAIPLCWIPRSTPEDHAHKSGVWLGYSVRYWINHEALYLWNSWYVYTVGNKAVQFVLGHCGSCWYQHFGFAFNSTISYPG